MSFISRRARRYADAIFALASERDQAEALVAEVERIATVLEATPELKAVLAHRLIPPARKLELVGQAFSAEPADGEDPGDLAPLSELGFNFLRLLIDHGRVELLDEIRAALGQLLDQRQGVVRATVTTAVPLLKSEREALAEKLRQITGAREVVVEAVVRKAIVGGLIVHLGDHVIDASIRSYLDSIRETLKRVRVSEFDREGFLDLNLRQLREQATAALERGEQA